MKDFLQGRPSVASTRSSAPNISLPSNLPPIANGVAIEETRAEDLGMTDQPLDDSGSISTCQGERRSKSFPMPKAARDTLS